MLKSVVLFFATITIRICDAAGGNYKIPVPVVQVFQTRGFRMTIPDDEGIKLVAFHVNVNEPFRWTSQGRYWEDLKKPSGNSWVYENDCVKLVEGDELDYWIYVQKYRLGYRREGQKYRVGEFSSEDEKTTTEASYITRPPAVASTTSSPTTTSGTASSYCNIFVQNVTQSIFHLENQMNVLREENSILRDLASGDNLRLNLTGLITLTGEPLEIVRFVLDEKLDVEARVVKNAWKTANATITFEVYTLDDKVDIIRRARNKLMQSTQIKITYK